MSKVIKNKKINGNVITKTTESCGLKNRQSIVKIRQHFSTETNTDAHTGKTVNHRA